MTELIAAAAARFEARSAQGLQPTDRPSERRAYVDGPANTVRSPFTLRKLETVDRNGAPALHIGGYASTTEQPYEMYDFFGPYIEVVTRGAFGATLAASPMVEFTVNHGAGGSLPMAHTRNGTLDLGEDETGFVFDAYADPRRSDVANLGYALERGDAAEASFKFRITSGIWSPDYTEYRIDAVDVNRGDVSAVNYGANPNASSGLRSAPNAPVRAVITDDDVRVRVI